MEENILKVHLKDCYLYMERRFGMFDFLSKYIVKPSIKIEKDMEDLQVNYKFGSIHN